MYRIDETVAFGTTFYALHRGQQVRFANSLRGGGTNFTIVETQADKMTLELTEGSTWRKVTVALLRLLPHCARYTARSQGQRVQSVKCTAFFFGHLFEALGLSADCIVLGWPRPFFVAVGPPLQDARSSVGCRRLAPVEFDRASVLNT